MAVTRLTADARMALLGELAQASSSVVNGGPLQTSAPETTEPTYLPPLPSMDERIARWFIGQLFTPQRLARFLRWFPWTYLRFRGFLKAWSFGRTVRQDVYIKRMAACEKCPARQVRIVPTRGGWVGKNYCGKCGCPEWRLSELKVKNRMVGWKCPLRRHEGVYGDETYRHLIPNQGCSSCGGAS